MIELPNGCSYTKPYVNPFDWDLPDAFLDTEWYIEYWFFDPSFKSTLPRGKRCNFKKGFAGAKTLDERRKLVRKALKNIKEKLESGYNPITKQTLKPNEYYNQQPKEQAHDPFHDVVTKTQIDISPQLLAVANKVALETEKAQKLKEEISSDKITIHILTPDLPFIDALWKAYRKIKGVPGHLSSVRGAIRAMNRAAFLLEYLQTPISRITPQHITLSFEVIAKINPKFSPKSRNKYRSFLLSLFKELALARVVKSNFILEIPILPEDEPLPRVLEEEEIITIDEYLKANYYHFWRYVIVFYASGSRETELALVKVGNVDIKKRQFTVWVLKGKIHREVIKPIPIHTLHIWKEILSDCQEYATKCGVPEKTGEVFIFSKFMKPQFYSIRPDQFGRRWKKYVKKELGIDKDMYKLKHLYSDRIAKTLSLQHAKEQNSHEYDSTTEIYAFNEEERRREDLKNVVVPFARRSAFIDGSPIPAKEANKLLLPSLTADSINIIKQFLGTLEDKSMIVIPSENSFHINIMCISSNIESHLGIGTLYKFSEGFSNGSIWVPACEMEFYVVHDSTVGRIKNRSPKVYVCKLIHHPARKEFAIVFKDNKIVKAFSGVSVYLTQFANEWLRMLASQYNEKIIPPQVDL
ncbi:Site-specific recombinase XerD [Chitinophaga sp. YR573]|uniref:tyrosine-type recombinase/integrase n=1 Tax=Chitinophaga sp. YR573 TaxID=1881040 RepID=UPI0008B6E5E6|nr:tyrosine-type recombinase/integrase [Chitinophaga sp. YR573]SEW21918.1 Site-specific recombinase XerD [Chitinophaga sp. YR573]